MPNRYKLLFSLVIIVIFSGFSFSPVHSQSSNSSGAVVSWGDQVLTEEDYIDYVNISAGSTQSLAVRKNGTVAAWGSNERGQGTVPQGVDDIETVSAGGRHNLALRSDGTVVAWGEDYYDQSTVPQGLDDVVAVAAGGRHSLALRSDGRVSAWGSDFDGQITVPSGLDGVVAVAAGGRHSLALRSDGTVAAWGYNHHGQSTVPPGLDDVVSVSAGKYHNLALRSDGTVIGWGVDWDGRSTVPSGLDDVVMISAGGNHSMALRSNGTVVAWGADGYGQSTVPSGLENIVAVDAGGDHSLALRSDGTVVAWGYDVHGRSTVPPRLDDIVAMDAGGRHSLALRLDGTVGAWGVDWDGRSTVPQGLDDVVAVSAGGNHSLALRSNGTVVAWGADWYGQSTVPSGLENIVAVDAGGDHSLALRSDGTIVAWGSDFNGQSTVPFGLNNVVAVAAGGYHSMALRSNGTVVAWGANGFGQSTVPPGLDDVVAVSAGMYFSLALRTDGTVVTWGTNNQGESMVPPGLNDVVSVDAGERHSLALRTDGTVVAWGTNNQGQSTVPQGLDDVVAVAAGGRHSLALVRGGDKPEPPAPIPDHKINFWVHSPDYEFDSIEWVFPDDSEIIPLSANNGFWGLEESQLTDSCDQNGSSDQHLVINKNEQRVGVLYVNLCDQIRSDSTFKAVLILNDEMDIENRTLWKYYSSTDEVMVSMLVAPDGFELDKTIAADVEPILAVHGVDGYYPYWGQNIVNEINGEDNYHFWQFYYPYDQAIEKSGRLLGEALEYLLEDQFFGLPLSYQTSDLKVLAHSMGGLVSRSHIESSHFNDTIQKLIMLGTPNHGSYAAYRLIHHDITGNIAAARLDKDKHAPAYAQMIPGSSFLMNLNKFTPTDLSTDSDYSYVSVAGLLNNNEIYGFLEPHWEIKNQDDGAVAVSSVSLIKFGVPLVLTNHFHSKEDNPENSDGLANARGLVGPLLTGDYVSLRQHPKHMGNVGFNDIPDDLESIEASDLGIVILDINFTTVDFSTFSIRSAYRNNNEIRIYSSLNNPVFAIGADKIKGDFNSNSSRSFLIKTKNLKLDDIGVSFEENNQVVEVGRYTGNPFRPWITIGEPTELEFQPLQTSYSGKIELTSAQRLMMKIPYSGIFLKQNKRSDIVQYVDSKVDTALIYLELPGESIDVPDYQIALTSPSGVEYRTNNSPDNWTVIEDKEQGYAYFYIPEPETGNWKVDHNPSINNVFVASSITSDIDIISRVQGDNHRVDEPVNIEIEIEGVGQLNSYEIETRYVCYDDNSEELEAGSLELQNVEAGIYEAQLNAPSESIGCTIEPELIADVGNEDITRYAFSSVDLKDNIQTSMDRDGEPEEMPNRTKLHQNYPNPFNPITTIRYELPESSVIRLEVYNIIGQQVAQLVNEHKSPGRYEISFDASNLSSGLYFYRLQTDSFIKTRQMMLIK